jgi:hypothetical protein
MECGGSPPLFTPTVRWVSTSPSLDFPSFETENFLGIKPTGGETSRVGFAQ